MACSGASSGPVQPEWVDEDQYISPRSSAYRFVPLIRSSCTFNAGIFMDVMLNLIRNPNITSSHLFRADIFYDSEKDATYAPNVSFLDSEGSAMQEKDLPSPLAKQGTDLSAFSRHMKADYRPRAINIEGFDLNRTIVRQLVPRNPNLDKPIVQTCHFLEQKYKSLKDNSSWEVRTLVVYLPHITLPEEVPFYHPLVKSLAFLHSTNPCDNYIGNIKTDSKNEVSPDISIHVAPFEYTQSLPSETRFPERLIRTGLHLLKTLHKHGTGRVNGYQKQVHHDQIIPQARFQDTYTRLKGKYAKNLINGWCEQTDPVKHVFEDLGIAAFLIELWRDMYYDVSPQTKRESEKFPGFVDIGCGNGVLVSILLQEGYTGWGFDARRRKSWRNFPPIVQENLKELTLEPPIFQQSGGSDTVSTVHSGKFAQGTFIISNHADELTLWTPLLGYLSGSSPFICIPCCSHDFTGSRFRAPTSGSAQKFLTKMQGENESKSQQDIIKLSSGGQPSAYASLCAYVQQITEELGYKAEKEMLRIPSTRNAAIIGGYKRNVMTNTGTEAEELMETKKERCEKVSKLVERELSKTVEGASLEWLKNMQKLAKSDSSNR